METIKIDKNEKAFNKSISACKEIIKENEDYIKDYIVIKYSDYVILGLNDESDIVSFLSVTEDIEADTISEIAVKEDYKHKGYGTMMVDHLKDISTNINVDINDQNTIAQSFFEKNGFNLEETDYGIKAKFSNEKKLKK